jgi:hypothetical protein
MENKQRDQWENDLPARLAAPARRALDRAGIVRLEQLTRSARTKSCMAWDPKHLTNFATPLPPETCRLPSLRENKTWPRLLDPGGFDGMRNLFAFNMVSLDGFFEGRERDINWHNVDDEFNQFAIEQTSSVGTILFGRVTYELMASYWPTPARWRMIRSLRT